MSSVAHPSDRSGENAPGENAASLSRAALQRHEESVFVIDAAGTLLALNPLAAALRPILTESELAKIESLAGRAISENRGIVDLIDVGEGETLKHLQATFVVVEGRESVYCFMRDLSLD